MISSIFISTTKRTSPFSVPPARERSPSSRARRSTSPVSPRGGLGEAQPRVLEELHRHEHAAVARLRDEIRAGDEIRQRLLDRLAHLLVVPQPVARAAREEVVPGGFCGDPDQKPYSCASSVVT
jgi:hypothetical protein